jgi:hypothetical protein
MTTIILQRLKPLLGEIPIVVEYTKGTPIWEFSKELAKKKSDFFKPLVKEYPILNLEYRVLCTQLIHNFSNQKSKLNYTELIDQLVTALAMAELLTFIYRDYLNVPREVLGLKKEQKIFRALLKEYNYQFHTQPKDHELNFTSPSSHEVREKTVFLNLPRLFISRIRRLLITTAPLATNLPTYSFLVNSFEEWTRPVFNYFAWIFFVPRFAVNSFLLLKHLIPGFWMKKEKEKNLGWEIRLKAQIERRWFELGNDLFWITGGLLTCLVLTGALAPISIYLNIGLVFWDVILAGIRAFHELSRIKKLQEDNAKIINEMRQQSPTPDEALREAENYQQHLQQRASFEQKRLLHTVINTSAIFLALCLTLPALAACNPLIPFIGALLMVLITIGGFTAMKLIEKQKPIDNISLISPKGKSLFATSPYVMFPSANTNKEKPQDNELNSKVLEASFFTGPSRGS